MRLPRLDRNLAIVLGARVAMSAARAVAGVVTALYLAAEGFSAVEIGAVFLTVSLATAVMAAGVGMVSDRVGRKPFLVAVPLLAAGAAAVYAFDRTPAVLFVCAAAGSFGRGAGAGGGSVGPYQPAEAAFVAEAVPAEARSTAFGRLAFASALGALAGGLLAGLARAPHGVSGAAATAAYRPAFLAAGVLAGVAGLVAFGLSEGAPGSAGGSSGGSAGGSVADSAGPVAGSAGGSLGGGSGSGRPSRWPRRSWPALWRLWITNSVNGVAIGMIGPFLSYWLFRRYGATSASIGLLFAVINVGSLASTLSAARIGRWLGTVRAIVVVRAVTGVLLIPMALAPWFWLAGAIYFVRMMVQRVGLPLRQSFVQDLADPGERASVAALSNLPAQGTMAGSQVLAGYLFDEVALAAPFEVAAVFQCANACLYAIFFKRVAAGGRLPAPQPAAGR